MIDKICIAFSTFTTDYLTFFYKWAQVQDAVPCQIELLATDLVTNYLNGILIHQS